MIFHQLQEHVHSQQGSLLLAVPHTPRPKQILDNYYISILQVTEMNVNRHTSSGVFTESRDTGSH